MFVCYAHEDANDVYAEIRDLQSNCVNVWFDEGISPASEWPEALARAISSCATFLYFVSPRSVASENCRREVNFALDQGCHMVVVHLEETTLPDGLRLSLSHRQAILRYSQDPAIYRARLEQSLADPSAGLREGLQGRSRPGKSKIPLTAGFLAVVVVAVSLWVWTQRNDQDQPIRALAVLPLQNLSADPSQDYFADGMTDSIIGEMVKLSSLKVISRTSVMPYKTNPKPIEEIAADLDVQGVMEGSVVKAGDRVKVSLRMLDARSGDHIWADTYERDVRDVLYLHSDIARAVTTALALELTTTEESRLVARRTIDPEAYDLYLQGLRHQVKVLPEESFRAVQFYERAIEVDPDYAEAYAALASVYQVLGLGLGVLPRDVAAPKIFDAAQKAIALDDSLGRAHASLGAYYIYYEWSLEKAEPSLLRAISLNPGDALVNNHYGLYLTGSGRKEEALRYHQRAIDADPLHPQYRADKALTLWGFGDYEQAAAELQQLLTTSPQFFLALGFLSEAMLGLGREKQAYEAERKLLQIQQFPAELLERYDQAFLQAGFRGIGRFRLSLNEEMEDPPPFFTAMWAASAKDREKTLHWLERAYEARSTMFTAIVSPRFDFLHDDPEFQAIVGKTGLPWDLTDQ